MTGCENCDCDCGRNVRIDSIEVIVPTETNPEVMARLMAKHYPGLYG